MKKENFIIDGNEKYSVNDIKKVTIVKTKYILDDAEPYIKVSAGTKVRRLLRKPISFIEDGYMLGPFCNGGYGGWHEKYYMSVEAFVKAIKKLWGQMPDGGYYCHLPIADYTAGFHLAPTKECIAYNKQKNCVMIKPHVNIYFDEDETESFSWLGHKRPRMVVKVFETDKEAEDYYNTFK